MTTTTISLSGQLSVSHATGRKTLARNTASQPPEDLPLIQSPPITTPPSAHSSYFWVAVFPISKLTGVDPGLRPPYALLSKEKDKKWKKPHENSVGAEKEVKLQEIHHFVAQFHPSRTAEAILKCAT